MLSKRIIVIASLVWGPSFMKRLLGCFLSVVLVQGSVEALARQLAKTQLTKRQISQTFTPAQTPQRDGGSKLASGMSADQGNIEWIEGTPFDRASGLSETSHESTPSESSAYQDEESSADGSATPATQKFTPDIRATSKAPTPRVLHAGVTPFLRRLGAEGSNVTSGSARTKRLRMDTPTSYMSGRRSRLTPQSVPAQANGAFSPVLTPRKSSQGGTAPSSVSKFVGNLLSFVTPTKNRRSSIVEQWFACESTRDALERFVMDQRKSGIFREGQIKSDVVNGLNSEGKTRLHAYFEEIIEEGIPLDFDVVECLLDLGADINKRDIEGTTSFQFRVENRFIRKSDFREIQKLIALGADPKLLNGSNETILHSLASPSLSGEEQIFDREMVDWWIKLGVNPCLQDIYGYSILHTLALRGSLATYIDLYAYLIKELKVDPNLTDTEGNGFLHILAEVDLEEASFDMLKKLQDLGVNMAAQNENGDYYISILTQRGKVTTEMVSWWKMLNPGLCAEEVVENDNLDSSSPAKHDVKSRSGGHSPAPSDRVAADASPLAYLPVTGKSGKGAHSKSISKNDGVKSLEITTPVTQKGEEEGKESLVSNPPKSRSKKGSGTNSQTIPPVQPLASPKLPGKGEKPSDSKARDIQGPATQKPSIRSGFIRRNAPLAFGIGAIVSLTYYIYTKSQKSGPGGTTTVQAS